MNDNAAILRRSTLTRVFASFKAPGFRLFYANSTFAAVDMNVRMAVHGWLVLELSNDSAFWVGMYALFLGMGQLLFSMVAGAMVDRFQRRTVLLVESVLSIAIALAMAVAAFFEVITLGPAVGIAFVMGCVRAVRFTATNRIVYDLVGPRQLINGVSLWRVSTAPMMVLGALLAGVLIEWPGIWAAYAFIGSSQVIALPFLILLRVRGDVERSNVSLLQQTLEGVRYAMGNFPIRTLFTISIVMEALGFAFLVMVPVMAKNVLGAGAVGMGFLHAGAGGGMLLATLIMAARGDAGNKPRIIFLNALGAGLALIGFAVSRSLPLSIFLATAVMALLSVYDLTLGALMQLVAPPHIRGRAVSLHSMAISFTALGGFVMGAVGSIVGVPVMIAAGGTGIVVNSWIRRPALLRIREHHPETNAGPVTPSVTPADP